MDNQKDYIELLEELLEAMIPEKNELLARRIIAKTEMERLGKEYGKSVMDHAEAERRWTEKTKQISRLRSHINLNKGRHEDYGT